MKKTLLLILLLTGFSVYSQEYKQMIEAGTFTVEQIQEKAEEYFLNRDRGRGSGWVQFKRWEYFALKMQDQNGYLKNEGYLMDEWARYSQIQNQQFAGRTTSFNDDWSEVGPTYWQQTTGWNPGVGRLSAYAVQESDQNHIIAGSIGGGIWKTTDGGQNWEALSDNHGNMYTYSLTMDQNNPSTYFWGSSGGRIYKSTDGGNVWTQIGSAGGSLIWKILIHPTNNDIMYACSQNSGLYKTTDGGTTWNQIHSGFSFDVEFDPNNPDILFASGSKVYRSTDGGDNFTEITGFGGRIKMIGVSPADSNKVYVVAENSGYFHSFYKSIDNGVSFTEIDHGNMNYFGYESDGSDTRGQAPRDMGIAVSPTNADEVHIVGINSWMSSDGGDTFNITSQWIPGNAANQNIGYCHADIDDIGFVGNNMYVVTDGGIFVAEDPSNVTSNYYRDLTTGMGIRQFYLMGVSQTDPVIISAGSQDNGTSIYRGDGQWYDWLGADGFESVIDINDPDVVYGTIYNGGMYRSPNQGNSVSSIPRPQTTGWVTPLEQGADGNLYFGGSIIYKSTDEGANWNAMSQDFGNFSNQLKIAPSNTDIMYASVGSSLYKTSNGGRGDWESLSGFAGSINSVAIHPTDANKVAIAVTSTSEKVYVSTDGGDTWEGISDNLPDFTAFALVWDDNGRDGLYLGMDYGVYYIDNQYTEWNLFNNKLPNVRVTELEINYTDNNLYVSTYGRGIWRSPRSNGVLSASNHILESLTAYPNPADGQLNISWNRTEKVSVRLFNALGQLVYYNRNVSLEEPLNIDVSQVSSGIYFLKVNSDTGSTTKRIIIR